MKSQKVLDLDDREKTEKEMKNYLEMECPHYFDSGFASLKLVNDIAIKLFEGEERSRVLVYNVKLKDSLEAFGTIGGILYPVNPPYSNVFSKTNIKNANIAASMHLYSEAKIRYGCTSVFQNLKNLEELAEMLEIPKELR